MGETTAIAWCHHSFNPWWGCTKIQAPDGTRSACDFCYAATFANRTGHDVWGLDAPRRFFGDKHWTEPLKWNRKAEDDGVRRRVFCASMADVFEDRRDLDEHRSRLFSLIEATPHLDWLLLTKRPEQMNRLAPSHWINGRGWPVNVWGGTTTEDQRSASIRLPRLLQVKTSIHFVSCEPLFEAIDFEAALDPLGVGGRWSMTDLDWVIVGGESGPKHQPLNLADARAVRDQCVGAGIPLFFKQVGGRTPKAGGDLLDGVEWKQFPVSPAS